MTMATRCPACGTVFRVVQDQLRVSAGWVRCGRCGEAFNAVEALVDLAAPPPPPDVSPEPSPTAPAEEDPTPPRPVEVADAIDHRSALGQYVVAMVDDSGESGLDVPPADLVGEPAAVEPGLAAAATAPRGFDDVAPSMPALDVVPEAAVEEPSSPEGTDDEEPSPAPSADAPTAFEGGLGSGPSNLETEPLRPADEPGLSVVDVPAPTPAAEAPVVPPSFLRRAERVERWRRPWVRATLSVAVLAALTGLAAQVAYIQRDWIAATIPAARPALEQACALIACSIGEHRQIESLGVESSGLVRVEGTSLYRLSVVLRNRAAIELAAPAIDLSLTDAQGGLIGRRVLTMADLGLPLRTLKGGSELPIQVSLAVAERPVSGYTVEIFYP